MTSALVLVNCHFPFDIKIMDKLSMMPYISAIYRTQGRYDLNVKVTAESEEKLQELISMHINKMPGVDATISLTVAKEHIASCFSYRYRIFFLLSLTTSCEQVVQYLSMTEISPRTKKRTSLDAKAPQLPQIFCCFRFELAT